MNIEQVLEMWKKDSIIDDLKLDVNDFSFVYIFNDTIKAIFQSVIENLY